MKTIKELGIELRNLSLGWISGGCDDEFCTKIWDEKWKELMKKIEKLEDYKFRYESCSK